tara:strand:+ start:533696 stop:534550 length:855 start_codon:yes stop_codon:yes gene_type:complete
MRLTLLLFLVSVSVSGQAEEPLLRAGDRVALLGGTFFEQMQSAGALEAEIQCRRPDWKLSFRNIGWSGDDVHGVARKRFDGPEDGFKRLLQDIETADPTVVLVAYGFAEASDGIESAKRFESGLTQLVEAVTTPTRRVILVSPIAMPGYRVKDYDQAMQICLQAVQRVSQATGTPAVSVKWNPSDTELNQQRLLPNAYGYQAFARQIADPLVGGQPCQQPHPDLVDLVVQKNQLFFHRYRPQNETYLLLFRKHEQGNNAVEIPQFDPLIEQADKAIWDAAATNR